MILTAPTIFCRFDRLISQTMMSLQITGTRLALCILLKNAAKEMYRKTALARRNGLKRLNQAS
eukprot:03106_1